MTRGNRQPRVRDLNFKEVHTLQDPTYKELNTMTRCLHMDDVQQAFQKCMLVPQRIRNSNALRNVMVLWFAPSQETHEHNFYGNVSFVIDWSTLLDEVGPNLYLIDQAVNNTQCFTRVLLTNQIHYQLQSLNLSDYGSVVMTQCKSFFHISEAKCIVRPGPHELQVGVECNDRVARRLFELCSVRANNHSHANRLARTPRVAANGKENIYQSYKCFRYNTAMGQPCPDNYSLEETEIRISSLKEEHDRHLRSIRMQSAIPQPKPYSQLDGSTVTYSTSNAYTASYYVRPKPAGLQQRTDNLNINVRSNSAQNSASNEVEGRGSTVLGSIISAVRYFAGKIFG